MDLVKIAEDTSTARYTGPVSIVPRPRITARPAPVQSDVVVHRPGLSRRVLRRVVEGPHAWGELEVWPSRYGYTSYCLALYPPGATRSERIRFRLLRAWPPIGILLGLVAGVAGAQVLPAVVALLLGGAAYGAGASGLALLAGPGRHRIRTVRACRGDAGLSAFDRGQLELVSELTDRLLEAEQAQQDGRLDAVAFELVHGEVWARLSAPQLR
jgi:hypothetical protein